MRKYVQFGCGLSNPSEWTNYDSSPTLRIQKIPILGWVLKKKLNVIFPNNIKYGDIVKGLKIEEESCDGIYCSHVLEHLSYNDMITSLKNSYSYLKKGGTFRMVLPDMEFECRKYISELEEGKNENGRNNKNSIELNNT